VTARRKKKFFKKKTEKVVVKKCVKGNEFEFKSERFS